MVTEANTVVVTREWCGRLAGDRAPQNYLKKKDFFWNRSDVSQVSNF